MIEILLAVAAAFGLFMAGLAVRVSARFQQRERLPMQWSFLGVVTWTAPRALALGLMPAFATGILTLMAVIMPRLQPRPGQEGLEAPILILMGLGFVAAQLFHLRLIDRDLQRKD